MYREAISYATNIANSVYADDSRKISGWDYSYLKRKFYDKLFKDRTAHYVLDMETNEYYVREFNEKTNPLAMVSMNTSHGLLEATGSFDSRFEEYRMLKIKDATGMSFAEFLELPEFFISKVVETIRQENAEKERIKANMTDNGNGSNSTAEQEAFNQLYGGSRY